MKRKNVLWLGVALFFTGITTWRMTVNANQPDWYVREDCRLGGKVGDNSTNAIKIAGCFENNFGVYKSLNRYNLVELGLTKATHLSVDDIIVGKQSQLLSLTPTVADKPYLVYAYTHWCPYCQAAKDANMELLKSVDNVYFIHRDELDLFDRPDATYLTQNRKLIMEDINANLTDEVKAQLPEQKISGFMVPYLYVINPVTGKVIGSSVEKRFTDKSEDLSVQTFEFIQWFKTL